METILKHFPQGTPLNPSPNQSRSRREPPSVIPIRSKIQSSTMRTPVFSKTSKEKMPSEDVSQSELNSPKLPIVCIRNNRTPQYKSRNAKYSKYLPRVLDIKPLFHDRARTYVQCSEEPDELKILKSRMPCFDY